jgi:hypothetical protein
MAFWSGFDHFFLGDTSFPFWLILALTPRYTPKFLFSLLIPSHYTWLVPLILRIDRVTIISGSTYHGVFPHLKRRMRSHTRANAAVQSITLPAIPISQHLSDVH